MKKFWIADVPLCLSMIIISFDGHLGFNLPLWLNLVTLAGLYVGSGWNIVLSVKELSPWALLWVNCAILWLDRIPGFEPPDWLRPVGMALFAVFMVWVVVKLVLRQLNRKWRTQ